MNMPQCVADWYRSVPQAHGALLHHLVGEPQVMPILSRYVLNHLVLISQICPVSKEAKLFGQLSGNRPKLS